MSIFRRKMGYLSKKVGGILYPPGVTRLDTKIASSLFLILFSTQLTLTTPFSYLPAMVTEFGYSDQDRGYYAGMIASSLFVGRFFGGYFWGWLTDRVGRKPVLILSGLLTCSVTLAFGFSTNIFFAITTRFLQGLFNGVIVVGRAAFAEICDDTNQAIGVSLVFAAWNSAIVLGPALGGFLATPTDKYPWLFTEQTKGFFEHFEFVLPSILISIVLLISILMIYITFKETKRKGYESLEDNTSNSGEHEMNNSKKQDQETVTLFSKPERSRGCCEKIKSWSIVQLCSDKLVVLVIVMFGVSGFCIIGFSELRSLWMATSVIYGGLSFSTSNIGMSLLVPALISAFLQPILFGRFERRCGGIVTLRVTLGVLFLGTLIFPFIHETVNHKGILWTIIYVTSSCRMIADISSRSAIALFINNSVYTDQVGRANGLAFSVQEIMRVASPTMFGSLFAWSINNKYHSFPLDYRFPFFILACFVLIILALSYALPSTINAPKPAPASEPSADDESYTNEAAEV